MRILIAPNAFKGTLGPAAAARAMARAFAVLAPRAEIELLPISDGGDGLLESLMFRARATGGPARLRPRTLLTLGPLLEPVRARWAENGDTAVIEMAEAAGLRLLARDRLAPLDAGTFGVGRLMRAAVRAGAGSLFVGLGGSASNDGGAGCASGFGFRLLDRRGLPIPPGARGLLKLERILPPAGGFAAGRPRVTGLGDVDNPLCGPRGSARVYGPQKGAGPAEVALMEKALLHYAGVIERELGVNVGNVRSGAAAGGLGAGLCAFFGAELAGGADFVLERLGFEEAVKRSDVVVTGEGRFDAQSFRGKAPSAAALLALKHGKPALLVCGSCAVKDPRRLSARGVTGVIALDRVLPLSELLSSPARALTKGLLLSGAAVSRFLS
jgi:glycerate kinase